MCMQSEQQRQTVFSTVFFDHLTLRARTHSRSCSLLLTWPRYSFRLEPIRTIDAEFVLIVPNTLALPHVPVAYSQAAC